MRTNAADCDHQGISGPKNCFSVCKRSLRLRLTRADACKSCKGAQRATLNARTTNRTIAFPRRSIMGKFCRSTAFAALVGAALLGMSATSFAAGYVETDLVVNQQVNGVPTLTDANGIVHVAKFFDPHLVNPWGVGESATSPFWVSDADVGLST